MVARLVWLKVRLLWNGLRADWQRRVGLPVTVGLLAWAAFHLARLHLDTMTGLPPEASREMARWAGLLFYAVWVTLPVVLFPLDEHLDPAQFALLPIPPVKLVAGLGVAALVSPSVVVPLTLLGADLAVFGGIAPAAVLGGVIYLAVLVTSTQLFSTAVSAVLRTRHGRNLSMLIVAGLASVGFALQQAIRTAVARDGLAGALLDHPLGDWALVLPPLAAREVVLAAAAGDWARTVLAVGVAVGWTTLLAYLWHRMLRHLLTTPEGHPGPGRRARRRGLVSGPGWGPVTAMVGKEIRFYLRDPRQRLVWTGAVIFLGLAVASMVVGTRGLAAFQEREWLPLLAPVVVLFVGLPIVLNLFGWERNAASFLFVLPAGPGRLLAGKNLAAGLALAVETAVAGGFLAWVSSSWSMLAFLPSLWVAAVGCQLAVGNLVSVIAPLRLPREGTDVFSQATEQGCLAIGAQAVGFGVIGLLLVVPASVVVLTVSFGNVIPAWFTHLFAVLWGVAVYTTATWLAGRLLARRVPEVVGWVEVV